MNKKVLLDSKSYKNVIDKKLKLSLDLNLEKELTKDMIKDAIANLKYIRNKLKKNKLAIKSYKKDLRRDKISLRKVHKDFRISNKSIKILNSAFIEQKSLKRSKRYGFDIVGETITNETYQKLLEEKTNNNIDLKTKEGFVKDKIEELGGNLSISLADKKRLLIEYDTITKALSDEKFNYRITKYKLSKNSKEINKINNFYVKEKKIKIKKLGKS